VARKKKYMSSIFYENRRKIISLLIVILFIVAGGYIYFQAYNLIHGPKLTVTSPLNGSGVSRSLISIEGFAENISYISMNNRQIFVDEEGAFNEKLLLSHGYNIITITAEDKFKRETKKTLEIVYK
jgi:hypothetical protein